jgi:negative regulator of sigma E activity
LQFASRHYVPDNSRNIVPVAYQPNWLPRGFYSDRKIQNRFINNTDKKQFSIFVDKPKNFGLPDGVYQKENFILIRKTHLHGNQAHTITIFGDIDVESGKKILNSIRANN